MAIDFLKNFIPMTELYKLKYLGDIIFGEKINNENESKRIYFLDAPDYGNLGDQAIAYAINEFARKYFPDYQMIEYSPSDYAKYRKHIKKTIKPDDLIFLTGGGNMGNRYRLLEGIRRVVICDFLNNCVVIFPQSISYSDDVFGHWSKRHSRKIYSRNKRLIICARERFSYEVMKALYLQSNVLLCPDIVLSLSLVNSEQRKGIGVCLRNDIERAMTDQERADIISSLKGEPTEITTLSEINLINKSNRLGILSEKWKEIGSKELVVTDRLHAMIFSYLLRVPCCVYRNDNRKIEGVYDWIKKCPYVNLIEMGKKIPAITTVDAKQTDNIKSLEAYYDNLSKEIKKGIR